MVLKRRHLAKAITWRICATVVTILSIAIVTRDIEVCLLIGSVDFFIKIVIYYTHERVWLWNKFGIDDTHKSELDYNNDKPEKQKNLENK